MEDWEIPDWPDHGLLESEPSHLDLIGQYDAEERKPMIPTVGFELRWDGSESKKYPHGYWYVCTSDGSYDAVGATIETALANLVDILHAKIVDLELGKK